MSGGFVKLYGSILRSSVWLESKETRLVWVTMLAMADSDGVVEASVGGLAHAARVERDECEAALQVLLSPDPDDRSGVADGRRIEAVRGGWRLINHRAYRELRSPGAERVAKHRATKALQCNDVTADPEAEAEAEQNTSLRSCADPSAMPPETDLGPAPPITPAESDDDAPPWLRGSDPAASEPPIPAPGSEPPGASDDVPRKRARAKAAKHGSVEAERVLARLNEIRSAWVAGSNLRNAAEVEGRLRDGYTVDDLLLVLEHKGRRAAMGPGPDRDYFDTISPFRRSNFDGNLSRAQNDAAEPSGRPERGMTPEQARAEAEQRWGQRR